MLKALVVFWLSVMCATGCFAQRAIVFKMEYQPQYTYMVDAVENMDMTMSVQGDSAEAIKVRAGGMLPGKIISTNHIKLELVTGERVVNAKKFPIKIKYTAIESTFNVNGTEMPPLTTGENDGEITGYAGDKSFPEIDSAASLKNASSTSILVIKTITKRLLNSIDFPNKPLRLGDVFSNPFNIDASVSDTEATVNGNIAYKLVSINNDGIANFETTVSGSTNTIIPNIGGDTKTVTMVTKVSGNGTLKFDSARHFFIEATNNITVDINMPTIPVNMTGVSTTYNTYKVILSANK